jgi:alkyl hydroperoxide reductase subunit F
MLDDGLKAQLKTYLANVTKPVELVATLDAGDKSRELQALLADVAAQSDMVSLRTDGVDARIPSFAIQRVGSDVSVTFAGLPMGHEFTSLILALLQVGGHPPKISDELAAQIRDLPGTYNFETYFSQSCQVCPEVVQALNLLSVVNPRIVHTAVDGALFQHEIEARQVLAVPSVFLNGEVFGQGRMGVEEIIAKLDSGAAERDAAKLQDREAFDVLIAGGGPAGAAAAVYAARKGIRTGVLSERFGGQVLDTMGIENFPSVPHTEGPRFAVDLETHVRAYGVDIMNLQRATRVIPANAPGGLIGLELANGATLKTRSLVLAPGARWRQMGVPGEADYRNKGVAYCPHCDGPLFKGKRVAVIGGGNSGVEAAIDLAGIVSHVTLIEFDNELRADAVLQRKLESLPNATVIKFALSTEVHGDGAKVTGISYKDRATDELHHIELEGIFVQIGLVPNTEWLKDSLQLTPRGEIEIDARGETSAPGVFAAGDATTVPYKQIVIAAGDGAKAALSAFDYLIRNSVAA